MSPGPDVAAVVAQYNTQYTVINLVCAPLPERELGFVYRVMSLFFQCIYGIPLSSVPPWLLLRW